MDIKPTCNCSYRTKVLGDGCSVCNPELAKQIEIDNQQEQIKELAQAVLDLCEMVEHWSGYTPDYFASKHSLGSDLEKMDKLRTMAKELL